jgi:hypothetical protein
VIPTLILFGLIFGRWWKSAIAAGAIGWSILLVADGGLGFEPGLAAGALLAALNTGVGVLVHQGALWAYRQIRKAWASRRA